MTKFIIVICFIFSVFLNICNSAPKISFNDLLIQAELNPRSVTEARAAAISRSLPVSIITTDNLMIDVKYVENGRLVYSVFTNFADIYDGGYSAYYEDVVSRINFDKAKIDYGNGNIVDNTNKYFTPASSDAIGTKYLMITESSNDRVYLFNEANGDLIDTAFIPFTRPQLQTPKHALQHYSGSDIIVSDQLSDVVQRFDATGSYTNVYAPVGATFDNLRGIAFRTGSNNLLVTIGGGTYNNTIQQCDPSGNYLGTFIPVNTAQMSSPFDILQRQNDILIANFATTNRIGRFDLNGTFLNSFYTGSSFGLTQQLHRLPNGLIAASAFGTPSGVAILDSNGTFIKLLTGVTGNRGIYLLGNGNYLTTNGAGAHEIDSSTGALIRTVVGGNSFQYISLYESDNLRLTLTINFEAFSTQDTITAELRSSIAPYNLIESKTGIGGSGSKRRINFSSAIANGIPYYLVVKHRNSISTWSSSTLIFINGSLFYNFTSASSQAFGNNMVNVGGRWSFYTADVNQDGIVDGSDNSLIDNDASNFVSGYVVTDLNNDLIVDGSDAAYGDNNASNFIGVVTP
ncbi:MAG: hypothetical protein ABIY50_09900 [Ignavibacteria bacterium]